MKTRKIVLRMLVPVLAILAMGPAYGQGHAAGGNEIEDMKTKTIQLHIEGGKIFTAVLADNSSAEALAALLAKGDVVIRMEDYARMEKVGPLGTDLPRNDRHTTTSAGDLILYLGNQFVIYYDSNTWSFTRLGKIEGVDRDELLSALGKGDVTVRLSLD